MRSRALTNYVRAPVEIFNQDLIIAELKELTHMHELEYYEYCPHLLSRKALCLSTMKLQLQLQCNCNYISIDMQLQSPTLFVQRNPLNGSTVL